MHIQTQFLKVFPLLSTMITNISPNSWDTCRQWGEANPASSPLCLALSPKGALCVVTLPCWVSLGAIRVGPLEGPPTAYCSGVAPTLSSGPVFPLRVCAKDAPSPVASSLVPGHGCIMQCPPTRQDPLSLPQLWEGNLFYWCPYFALVFLSSSHLPLLR